MTRCVRIQSKILWNLRSLGSPLRSGLIVRDVEGSDKGAQRKPGITTKRQKYPMKRYKKRPTLQEKVSKTSTFDLGPILLTSKFSAFERHVPSWTAAAAALPCADPNPLHMTYLEWKKSSQMRAAAKIALGKI